jgi:hypothetical protein
MESIQEIDCLLPLSLPVIPEGYPRIFPCVNVRTLMIERQPVPVTIVMAAIIAPEWEIDTFTADRTGMV